MPRVQGVGLRDAKGLAFFLLNLRRWSAGPEDCGLLFVILGLGGFGVQNYWALPGLAFMRNSYRKAGLSYVDKNTELSQIPNPINLSVSCKTFVARPPSS